MGMPAYMVDRFCGYKGLSEELASFNKVNGRDNECFYGGYTKYQRGVGAYFKARQKHPLGVEIEDMRSMG